MKNYISLATLVLCMSLLTGYNFISAQWSDAPGIPPTNNTPAPINVSDTTQAKSGNFMANILAAATSTWSPRYCDGLGNNCWDPTTGTPGGGTSLGVGQTWQSMTGRSSNVWYHNNTGKPIMVYVGSSGSGGTGLYVNTTNSDTGMVKVDGTDADSGERVNMTSVIPVDSYYKYIGNIVTWSELR
jgi:hypothetical protein